MKTLIPFIQMLLLATALMGQPDEWQDGIVVLQEGRALSGSIHHPKGFSIILIQNKEERTVFTADKVNYFSYYDSASNINRRFVSIKEDKKGSQFYEQVITGEVSVLRKLRRYADKYQPDEIDAYQYFVLTDSTLELMMHFRNKIYPRLLEARGQEIQSFVRNQRLNPNEMRSALLIIMEYNRIIQNNLQARAN